MHISRLRLYDLRQPYPTQVLGVHPHKVTCVQMDEWKVISGGDDGYIYGSVHYWDRRMGKKLWHLTNRYFHHIMGTSPGWVDRGRGWRDE